MGGEIVLNKPLTFPILLGVFVPDVESVILGNSFSKDTSVESSRIIGEYILGGDWKVKCRHKY